MSFEKNFCPSPWFHMRINNSGSYEYCRWQKLTSSTRANEQYNIINQLPSEYFQHVLSPLRQDFLNGHAPTGCDACYTMEKNNKVSGRQRQLLKIGVLPEHFTKSLASSCFKEKFDYSYNNNGVTNELPQDWQIDLGNYCNSACIFCYPEASSRLASEFKSIGMIDQIPPPAWCNDRDLVTKFVDNIMLGKPRYLHFIGGETLITPGFKKILELIIETGRSNEINIGFTTNLTIWDESICVLLERFNQINLGLSIESIDLINDYVRWPSRLPQTKNLLDRWVDFANKAGWIVQLRTTPTCLTVHSLSTVYDYAWENNLSVESCNFLHRPEFLRIEVLPEIYKKQVKEHLLSWVDSHRIENLVKEQIINTRSPLHAKNQILQDIQSYINYIDTASDESWRLPDMIKFIKQLEQSRGNCILNYLPQYEQLFRSAGY